MKNNNNTKTTIYYNLAVFEIYEAIVNAGYQSHINPGELARDLVLQGKYGMLDGNEIEENLHLDYKSAGALSKIDRKKDEITKDVSALANSDGGIP